MEQLFSSNFGHNIHSVPVSNKERTDVEPFDLEQVASTSWEKLSTIIVDQMIMLLKADLEAKPTTSKGKSKKKSQP